MTDRPRPQLRRDIFGLGAVLLVLNGMIGAGIFALPERVAATAGGFSLWLFPLIGLLFLAIVLCFAELASRYEGSGGPVLYAGDAFGPLAGFQAGWLLFFSRMTALAANSGVLFDYLGREVPALNTGLGRGIGITLVLSVLTAINVLGVRGAMRALISLSLLKVLPLLALVLWGLTRLRPELLAVEAPARLEDLQASALAVVYAFVGFETVSATAGETRNARRSIPRALIWTLVATALLYSGVQVAYLAVADQLPASPAPLLWVGQAFFGETGYYLLLLAAVASLLGNLHTSVVAAPRLIFALAELGQLPRVIASVHRRFATPWVAITCYGAGGLVLALWIDFEGLSTASSLCRTLVYGLCALAVPVLRRAGPAGFQLRGGLALPVLAALICGWLVSLASLEVWGSVGLLVASGLILQFLGGRRTRSE